MKKDSKNIDDLFKEELGSYTETPPPAVWDALEKRISQTGGPNLLYRRLGYLALLLLGVSLSVSLARVLSGDPGNSSVTSTIAAVTPTTKIIAGTQDAAPVKSNYNAVQDVPADKTNSAPANETSKGPANETNKTQKEDNAANATTNDQTTNTKHPALTAKNKPAPITHKLVTNRKTSSEKDDRVANKQELPQPENVYNAVAPNTPAKGPAVTEITTADKNQKEQLPAAPKKDILKVAKPAEDEDEQTHRPDFNRFEAGIKGGYERSFSDAGATKFLLSPYLQYNLSSKFAIMTQPAIKYANVNITKIGNDKSYYKENADSSYTKLTTTPVYGGVPLWATNYSYYQTHDSIVKSYTNGGTYMEIDLPVLMKYYITKGFSVYGGANISYSKLSGTGVKENTYEAHNIAVTKSAISFSRDSTQVTPQPVSNVITYQGTPITNYTGPLYSSPTGGLFRFGYMLGFSYEYSRKWLFDALIQQTPAKSDVVSGYNINLPLSAPYFRLTIGYKLIK